LEDLSFTLRGLDEFERAGYPDTVFNSETMGFKLISASWSFWNRIGNIVSQDGRSLPIPVVFSIGNQGYPGILSEWDDPEYTIGIERYLRRMGTENLLLMVAGYEEDDSGRIVREAGSTGCADVPEICIYAPMHVGVDNGVPSTVRCTIHCC